VTLIRRIQRVLTSDLLSKKYAAETHPLGGHCYVAAEALFHAMGGKEAGLTAYVASYDGCTHWWLQDARGRKYDPTKPQYTDLGLEPPYHLGRAGGFLTKQPSKRAKLVLDRAGIQVGSK
jgi:hypothetical protein